MGSDLFHCLAKYPQRLALLIGQLDSLISHIVYRGKHAAFLKLRCLVVLFNSLPALIERYGTPLRVNAEY